MVALQLEAWQEAFVPILPPAFEVPTAAEIEPRQLDAMRLPGVRTLVAEVGGALRGWIGYGANRDPDAASGVAEVRALFVHPLTWRQGVGSALLERALGELAALGYHEATLWSFEANEPANAFYERHGFRRDGARHVRGNVFAGAVEIRYRRPLAPA